MKKTLLLSLACACAMTALAQAPVLQRAQSLSLPAAVGAPAREAAEGSVWVKFDKGFTDAIGYGQACYCVGAMLIPEEVAKAYKGSKITEISFALGTLTNTNVTVFISKKLNRDPNYSEVITGVPTEWNTLKLATPYEFDGSALYVGYMVRATKNDAPYGFDGTPTDYDYSGYIMAGSSSTFSSMYSNRTNIAGDYGSLCIRAKVEGDIPADKILTIGSIVPVAVGVDTPFYVTYDMMQIGYSPLSSLTLKYDFGEGEKQLVESYDAKNPFDIFRQPITGTLHNPGAVNGTVSVTKVNDTEQVDADSYAVSTVVSTVTRPRTMVVEEGTALACGWCPRGIVGLDQMKKAVGDRMISIAAHQEFSGTDPMIIDGYLPLAKYIAGFPGCEVNRNTSYATDPSFEALSKCFEDNFDNGSVDIADIDIQAEWATLERSSIKVKTSTTFGVDKEKAGYGLVYVLIENGVGPYKQTNYYSGGSAGPLDGWENYPSVVEWTYNEIPRYINQYSGDTNAFPATIEKDVAYENEAEVPVLGLYNFYKSPINVNPDNTELIVMIVTSAPRSIIAAKVIPASEIVMAPDTPHYQQIVCDQKFDSYYEPGTTVEIEAYSSMELPLTYTLASGDATLDGNKLTFNGTGTVQVIISQAGAEGVLPANPLTLNFVCKNGQVITWEQEFVDLETGIEYDLIAVSSSNLPVSYKLKSYSTKARIVNDHYIRFSSPATVTVVASQSGNAEYAAAEKVEKEITCELSGIEEIAIDEIKADDKVFDLKGVQVKHPAAGQTYIVVRGTRAFKALIK